ncbi:hypothetical protein PRZ48_001091 [Zasmidium cellare]|uniref:Uncharacterized protein n=1 Tax=Zasmidium cellare TaxID=395010 RepID=A0ABR0F1V7_ZASCE|nr:hypothetical protein PRZ48_001091 [Zasmidium cellare]
MASQQPTKKLRLTHPQEQFTTALDLGNFSMDIQAQMLPGLASEFCIFGIYAKRRPMLDKSGNRLHGSRPYDFNKAVPVHFAYALTLLENATSDVVFLCGRAVGQWFEELVGPIEDEIEINGVMRQVYYTQNTMRAFSVASQTGYLDEWFDKSMLVVLPLRLSALLLIPLDVISDPYVT